MGAGKNPRGNGGARVGIKDVAERAGVSVGTVSNVLNRPEIVSDSSARRVREAIEELGFVRNEPARQLRTGGSRTLAYVVLDAANPFFTDVAAGVEEVAAERGLAVYLCNSRQSADRQASYLELLGEQRVLGALVTPVRPGTEGLAVPGPQGMPIVLVDRQDPAGDFCSVSVDDVLGGELAVRHLLDGGHRRIAFVGGPLSIGQVADRHAGAGRAASAGGAELTAIETAATTAAEGRGAGQRLLGIPAAQRPTAAFCANDLLALGLLQELAQRGVRVPEELAIVGYDDIEFAESATVPLSSIRQPRHRLGRTAAELLLREREDGPGHRHEQVRFEPELVVRASSVGRGSGP
jgi:LacI family transcriptional regulator